MTAWNVVRFPLNSWHWRKHTSGGLGSVASACSDLLRMTPYFYRWKFFPTWLPWEAVLRVIFALQKEMGSLRIVLFHWFGPQHNGGVWMSETLNASRIVFAVQFTALFYCANYSECSNIQNLGILEELKFVLALDMKTFHPRCTQAFFLFFFFA